MKLKDLEKAIPFKTVVSDLFKDERFYVGHSDSSVVTITSAREGTCWDINEIGTWRFKPGTPLKEGLTLAEAVNSGESYKQADDKTYFAPNFIGNLTVSEVIATNYILKPDEPEKKTRVFYEWIDKDGLLSGILITKDFIRINGKELKTVLVNGQIGNFLLRLIGEHF